MKRKRILIAVNSPRGIEKLSQLLISSGYEVKVTDDGAKALSLSREFRPHLIFAELNLAKVDGHHLLRELKAHPGTKHIPFIAMSKHRSVDERVHTMSLGVDDYVTVPFDTREVVTRFEIILNETELLETMPKRQSQEFSGKLTDLNAIEVIQTLEIGAKTGSLHVQADSEEGLILIKDGEIINAHLGELHPKQALFRIFTWTDGVFRFENKEVEESSQFAEATSTLISQGLIYRDRWDKICRNLPPLQTYIQQETTAETATEDEQSILTIANGSTKVVDLIQKSKLDDLRALLVISKLFKKGFIKQLAWDESNPSQNGISQTNQTREASNSKISRLVGSFLNPENANAVRENSGNAEFYRAGNSHASDSAEKTDTAMQKKQQFLNKSELLMIREKLSNGKSG